MVSLIASSCTVPTVFWHKEGAPQEEFYQTNYTCLQQSQQPESRNIFAPEYPNRTNTTGGGSQVRAAEAMRRGFEGGYNNSYQHETGMRTNNLLFTSCMHAHGWYQKAAELSK